MAGPLLGFGQANSFQNIQQPSSINNINVRPAVPREKEIQPQGTNLAGTEESNKNDQGAQFDAQQFAEQLLSQKQDIQRGSVIDVLI